MSSRLCVCCAPAESWPWTTCCGTTRSPIQPLGMRPRPFCETSARRCATTSRCFRPCCPWETASWQWSSDSGHALGSARAATGLLAGPLTLAEAFGPFDDRDDLEGLDPQRRRPDQPADG